MESEVKSVVLYLTKENLKLTINRQKDIYRAFILKRRIEEMCHINLDAKISTHCNP